MPQSRSNRQSLTMPVQESTLTALRGLEMENKPGYSQKFAGSRERLTIRNEATSNIDQRPNTPTSPTSPALPSNPLYYQSPVPSSPRQESRGTFKQQFLNSRANVSEARESAGLSNRQTPKESSQEHMVSKTKSTAGLGVTDLWEPAPDLSSVDSGSNYSPTLSFSQTSQISQASRDIPRRPVPVPLTLANSRSTAMHNVTPGSPITQQSNAHKSVKHKFFNRKNSSRAEDLAGPSKPNTPVTSRAPDGNGIPKPSSRDQGGGRNPSPLQDSEEVLAPPGIPLRAERSQSFRSDMSSGSAFMKKMQASAKTVGRGFNSGANKLFSSSTSHHLPKTTPEDPIAQELIPNYKTKHLMLSLVEQTRYTRIARRLEDSKDKTEFWMPALPWRCIDFLNFNGCEAEGLYRVNGSVRVIELWWQRFDQSLDINLFEVDDLHDVNVIGSLFKRWLRDLPEPIFPKSIQKDLDSKYQDMTHAPEELKEVLSKLPPWNYYLLFAITCHLSLLNAYEEKNKMNLSNLFICFGNSLQLSAQCFYWLVGDWRSCWTGCTTEKDALELEYRILAGDNEASPGARKPSFSSAGSAGSTTLHSEIEQKHHAAETQIRVPQQFAGRRKENRPLRLSPGRSKENDQDLIDLSSEEPDTAPLSPGYPRSNSNVPELELDLPGEMSPLFTTEKLD